MQEILKKSSLMILLTSILLALSACGTQDGSEVFVKANPPVDAEMDYSPRTLRIFLTELPDIENSSVTLTGADGDVPLTRFHTMGANDLMIEIEEYPLPNGQYTVDWTARFADGDTTYGGSYQFAVAVPE